MITTFDVDFNHIARGQVITNRNRADGPFHIGDHVIVADVDEDMRYEGTVARIADDGHVFLDVDWASQP